MGSLAFLRQRILLMHASGIPVRADYRWVFVIFLMTAVTAASINSATGNLLASLLLGLVTTVVFFASIFLHELAHAVAARWEGVEVVEIILHPFGGMARMKHQPETPRAEFRIAIAGPVASFAIAIFFALLMALANAAGAGLLVVLLLTLAIGNFLLAVFNLFPGYPLDGGRVLRAYLWKSGRDLDEATVLTGRCGQGIGGAMIAIGLLIALTRGDLFTGFWTILVGLFLYDSATGIIREVKSLAHVLVEDVMRLPTPVDPDADVMHFVDHILPFHRVPVFPVAKDKQLYGILSLEDLKSVERERWRTTLIRDVMRPVTPDHFVEMHTSFADAQRQMRENGVGAVGVLDAGGRLVGFISGRVKKAN